MKAIALLSLALTLTACGKIGLSGIVNQSFGNWTELQLPSGCIPKEIAAEDESGVAVLCEDGRVFH